MDREISTRALLDSLADAQNGETLNLGGLLDQFRTRAYGVFVLVALLPAFVPLPVGAGAISGPLIALAGLQLLARMSHPWIPGFLARRPISRDGLARFRDRASRLLRWLERLSRPRTEAVIDHPLARAFTGLLLVLLGVLLALPVPGTNYPFGLILLAFAIALVERDGRLMLVAWALGTTEIALVAVFSGQLAGWAAGLMA
ncbi:exopolysaccharide biosynthesis protein [Arenimonas fontis]|uniref:Exopolysaccharide biosynthesis protein n=1 Tax=Arenimonas fontis TaxID=2608255 RepID=A0A5B2ZDX7_9GAMM|nr:exopolysaccharide biosynthesis protein [Arenimonas fontis]KAA2285833.1 exopolysaccharide biosynthesis protein [Arenimonas fontis]